MYIEEKELFNQYPLSEEVQKALHLLGYQKPTPIQQKVIGQMLEHKNVVVKSPTGTGKTAAFAIPICEQIDWDENHPQALILEPTRELTDQVRNEIFHIGRMKRIKVPALFGGFPIDKQIQTLRQKSHIAVGTPGRVMDHIRRDSLKLDKVTYLVIDEADLMLDMGFIDDIKAVLDVVPDTCKICLFSATLKPEIQGLVETYVPDMVYIEYEPAEDEQNNIRQVLYRVPDEEKYQTFIDILKKENPQCCLIFCGTREMVNVLFQKLRRNRIFCGMLHGEMEQKERLKTVDAFRRGGFRFLIATDVAARGVDFEHITHVINYDFPTGRETYVHRIGRSGRNGKSGTAISLVCKEDLRMLQSIEAYTGWKMTTEVCEKPTDEEEKEFWASQRKKTEIKAQKGDSLNQGITRLAIGGGRKSKIRTGDIVATICNIKDVGAEDIGVIDIRDSLSYVEILNQKGGSVFEHLQKMTLKGKVRKVRMVRST